MRAPANHCGLYGLRPTHGRVSLEGSLDLSPSFDTCSWFSRDIDTYARVADVLLGADEKPLPAKPRLWMPTEIWALLSPEVRTALQPALDLITRTHGAAQALDGFFGDFDELYWSFRYIQSREAWATDGDLITRYQPPLGSIGNRVWDDANNNGIQDADEAGSDRAPAPPSARAGGGDLLHRPPAGERADAGRRCAARVHRRSRLRYVDFVSRR